MHAPQGGIRPSICGAHVVQSPEVLLLLLQRWGVPFISMPASSQPTNAEQSSSPRLQARLHARLHARASAMAPCGRCGPRRWHAPCCCPSPRRPCYHQWWEPRPLPCPPRPCCCPATAPCWPHRWSCCCCGCCYCSCCRCPRRAGGAPPLGRRRPRHAGGPACLGGLGRTKAWLLPLLAVGLCATQPVAVGG